MIISAVTAASSLEAARSVAPYLAGNHTISTSIRSRQAASRRPRKLLGDKARYVDVAVIAPIYPARHKTPMLIAGPHVEAISPLLAEFEMRCAGRRRNRPSRRDQDDPQRHDQGHRGAHAECFLAASRAGVLDEVTASIKNNYPSLDWAKWRNTTSNAWRATVSAAPRRWKSRRDLARTRARSVDGGLNRQRQREMGGIGKEDSVRASLTRAAPPYSRPSTRRQGTGLAAAAPPRATI